MKKPTSKLITKKIIDKEIKNGSLFILEENLDKTPTDWVDCVLFIYKNGMKDEPSLPVIIIDGDKEFEKINNLTNKDRIKLLVFNKKKRSIREIYILKTDNDVRYFFGGENLRMYCDERNIFYRSMMTDDGLLLSFSDLCHQKCVNDDCRNPSNP